MHNWCSPPEYKVEKRNKTPPFIIAVVMTLLASFFIFIILFGLCSYYTCLDLSKFCHICFLIRILQSIYYPCAHIYIYTYKAFIIISGCRNFAAVCLVCKLVSYFNGCVILMFLNNVR